MFDEPEAPTRKGMEELGRRFAAAQPEAVIVVTPHGLHVDGHFAVVRSSRLEGDASQWTDADTHYAGPGRPRARRRVPRVRCRTHGLPALGITFGSTAAGSSTMPLDWGALIPLWFMRAPAVVVTPCRALSNEEHVRAGAALAQATGDRRVAFIASADHGHGHTRGRPVRVRRRVRRLRRADPGARARRTASASSPAGTRPSRSAAKADSFWQLLMLHGALGDGFEAELLSYEAPTYFGMLTARFARKD